MGIPAPAMPMPSAPPLSVPVAIPTPVGGWNPNAMCDGIRAEERALYLQQNQGMTTEAARQQVMREFPAQFAGPLLGIQMRIATVFAQRNGYFICSKIKA